MGHNDSGDHLNIASRCLLIGLEQAVKIMVDILLAACSLKEAYLMGARLLANAAKKKWIFSRKKFSIGASVTYCGLTLTASPEGKVSILPSKDKVEMFRGVVIEDNSELEVEQPKIAPPYHHQVMLALLCVKLVREF